MSYSTMQFAFWASLDNRMQERERERERERKCFIEGDLNSAVENIFLNDNAIYIHKLMALLGHKKM